MANISDIVNSKTNQVELPATRTNTVDNSVLDIVTASGALSTPITSVAQASAYAWKDNNDVYWMHMEMTGNSASTTLAQLKVTGIGIEGAPGRANQAFAVVPGGTAAEAFGYVNGSSSEIFLQKTSTADTSWTFSATFRLTGKPTWFDDNLMTSSGLPVATADTYGVTKRALRSKWRTNIGFTGTSFTPIDFDTVHSEMTNIGTWVNDGSGIITIPANGTYRFTFHILGNTSIAGNVVMYLYKNGSAVAALSRGDSTGSDNQKFAGSATVDCVKGDTVYITHNDAGGYNFDANPIETYFEIVEIP